MADNIDAAQAHAERMTAQAINHHMAAQQHQTMTVGTAECMDCGEAIPASRRAALPYATRCIDCQTIVEHRGRYGRAGPMSRASYVPIRPLGSTSIGVHGPSSN